MKDMNRRLRCLMAAAVVAVTAVLSAGLPLGALNASATQDEAQIGRAHV